MIFPTDGTESLWVSGMGGLVRTIETDKQVYQLGETVRITQRIINQAAMAVEIPFTYAPALEFCVLSGTEVVAPGFSVHFAQYWVMELASGESYEMQWNWDQTDAYGDHLAPGYYDVLGITSGITYVDDPMTSIRIVPEPSASASMMLVLGFLVTSRGRSGKARK